MKLSNYFIQNNKTKIKPKKTELLNLFSTFMTQNEKPYQSKYTDIKNPIEKELKKEKEKVKEKPKEKRIKTVRFFSDKNTPHYISSINSSNLSLNSSSSESSSSSDSERKKQIERIKKMRNKKYTIREIKSFKLHEIDTDPYLNMNLEFYLPEMNFDELSKVITHRKFSSQKFHEIKANYLISKGMENDRITMIKIQNAFKEERTLDEIEESYDTFVNEDLKLKKLQKIVLNFLQAKDNRLNQVQIEKSSFFNSFENRVNFIFDSFKVPNIKNHFIDLSNKLMRINNYPNIIDNGIREYLNILKFTIQRREDMKNVNFLNYEKNIKKNKNMLNKRDELDDKDNFLRFKEEEDNNTKIYELDSFFIHKYTRYGGVHLTEHKIKYIIYYAKNKRVQLEEEELEEQKDKITFKYI